MNIYDIADEAGVSISTVSRVLNNHPNVTAKTRERVVHVLEKHNYVPSSIAKSLVNKATKSIGVLVLDIRHMHYANISFTIEQKLSTYGYHAILCNTGYDHEKTAEYIKMLAEKQVDGVIMVGSVFSCDETDRCIDAYLRDTPIVMHNATFERDNTYIISTEDAYGIDLSMDYLVTERGLRDIVYVQDYDTPVGFEKGRVFRRKHEELGIPFEKERIVRTKSGIDGGIRGMHELTARNISYDAIIGCDDITCLGVMKALRKTRRRVPEDVSIIGYNNTVFSEVSEPPLTVVDNKEEMTGIALARSMADIIRGRDVPAKTVLYPELVRRDTA